MSNPTGFVPPSDLHINSFGYSVGVSVGVVILITTITIVFYICTRTAPSDLEVQRGMPDSDTVLEVGLDEATISGYPKLPYTEANVKSKDSTSSCCSICLEDYKDDDMLHLLSDCSHLFHVKCIDQWLCCHPTCPVCRSSTIPTPLSTPPVEAAPLASRRIHL